MSNVVTKKPDSPYPKSSWDTGPRKTDRRFKKCYLAGVNPQSLDDVAEWHQKRAENSQFTVEPVTVELLADMNWGTTDPAEIQWYLFNELGCVDEIQIEGVWQYKLDCTKVPWIWGTDFVVCKPAANVYPIDDWKQRPRAPVFGEKYIKYRYARETETDTLTTIATRYSDNHRDRPITASEIAEINWGTTDLKEIRSYHLTHNKAGFDCPPEPGSTGMAKQAELRPTDGEPWLWMPAGLVPLQHPYRSPGDEVGHVAPYTEEFPHVNTLVVPATYVVELQLGDMDAMFECGGDGRPSEKGKMQRLQALGYYYRPLGHSQANVGYRHASEYFCDVVHGNRHTVLDDVQRRSQILNYELVEETRNNIVCVPRGHMPRKGEFLDGRLPKKGEVGMIRLPGGYCFNDPEPLWDDSVALSDADAKYRFGLGDDMYKLEKLVCEDNPCIGRIPIVARVYKITPNGKAVPAEGVMVYFQLVKPDELKSGHFLTPDPELRNEELNFDVDHKKNPDQAISKRRGPKRFVDEKVGEAIEDDQDPRVGNCPTKWGGKRDGTVGNLLFEVETTQEGFHSPKPRHGDFGTLNPANMVSAQAGSTDHKYAVRAKSNDKGYAGVVFMPSRQSGDRYKLRAYVGPPTLGFTGDDVKGPVAETGTMVVWRNVRLNHYLRRPIPSKRAGEAAPELMDIIRSSPALSGIIGSAIKKLKPGILVNQGWKMLGLEKPYDTIDLSERGVSGRPWRPNSKTKGTLKKTAQTNYRPAEVQFRGPVAELRGSYCELIIDAPDNGRPVDVPHDVMRAAFDCGIRATSRANPVAKNVDWNALVFFHNDSPFIFNVRRHNEYNRLKGQAFDELTEEDMKKIGGELENTGLAGVMAYFTKGGNQPGLACLHTPFVSSWQLIYPDDSETLAYEGFATAMRGMFLTGTEAMRQYDNNDYDISAVANHEYGHCLGRTHQPPNPTSGQEQMHEPQVNDPNSFRCVMCYMGCYGNYCGRCVLSLRGWMTKSKGTSNGA